MSRPHAFNEYRFACRYLPCRARDAHPAPLRVRYQPLSQPSDGMARAATEIALRPRWRSHIPGVRLQYIVRAWTIIYRTLTLPLTRRLPIICARCGPSFKGFIGTANGTDCSQTYDCATKQAQVHGDSRQTGPKANCGTDKSSAIVLGKCSPACTSAVGRATPQSAMNGSRRKFQLKWKTTMQLSHIEALPRQRASGKRAVRPC